MDEAIEQYMEEALLPVCTAVGVAPVFSSILEVRDDTGKVIGLLIGIQMAHVSPEIREQAERLSALCQARNGMFQKNASGSVNGGSI